MFYPRSNNGLALFDFDGTLTTKDSLPMFLKYYVGNIKYYQNLFRFLPVFLLYKLHIMNNSKAKEILLNLFFNGEDENRMKSKGDEFSIKVLPTILNRDMVDKLIMYKTYGYRVIVVSASLRCWLDKWCADNHIELLCTEMEFQNGKCTGSYSGSNCYGREKLNRILSILNPDSYDEIVAFGDSSGDLEMLELRKSFNPSYDDVSV